MRCGTAETDITPPVGTEMSGFVARIQPSLGTHDPLAARALFLEKEGRRFLWLQADILAFSRPDVGRLKAALFERFGLHEHEILAAATHTHSGPATIPLLECGERDAEYVEGVLASLERISGEAIRAAGEAQPVFAEGNCMVGRDRRGFAPGHVDSRMPVVAWRRRDGSYVAVLASYAVHGVAMGPANRLFSADIFGRASRTLSGSLPGSPLVIFANGACGNVNPPDVGNSFEAMEKWGDDVAASARRSLDRAVPAPDSLGPARIGSFTAAPGTLTPAEVDATIAGSLSGDERFLRAQDRWRQLLTSDRPPDREHVQAELDVQSAPIAGITFACFAGELFSQAADALGTGVYPVSYANGDIGYICPQSIYAEGGYEPDVACLFYGTNPIPPGTFERAMDLARDLIGDTAAAWRLEEQS